MESCAHSLLERITNPINAPEKATALEIINASALLVVPKSEVTNPRMLNSITDPHRPSILNLVGGL